jgi:nitrate/nitrite-specific signal transduction histidine kinase
VAVLFQPLRGWFQQSVNRLFYGQHDEPYTVLSRLGQRLEGTLAPDAVLPAIVETVAQALKLPYMAVSLKQGEAFRVAAAYGSPVGTPLSQPLAYQGEVIGHLLVTPRSLGEPLTPPDRRLLEDLTRQIGMAAHAVRLTDDLQRSRERLVYALRPPALDDLGLVAAIRERATQQSRPAQAHGKPDHGEGLHISVDAPARLPSLPAAVEVAAYRIVQEALTNVVRHAQAHTCTVRLFLAEAFHVEISDDGVGFPPERQAGVGMLSMRERAAEKGSWTH